VTASSDDFLIFPDRSSANASTFMTRSRSDDFGFFVEQPDELAHRRGVGAETGVHGVIYLSLYPRVGMLY
jgi:hypothetical protein